MTSFIEAIARYRHLVLIAAAIIMTVGLAKISSRSLDLLPEFTPPIVEVQTEALGLSAEEVESLITIPMEADLLNGISWIETIRSQSLPGLSTIVMVFEEGTDIWKARQLVQERLTQAHALPHVSRPPVMLQPVSSTSRVMQVSLSSSELTSIQVSVEARWNIRPRLMGVAGVANVSIWGLRNRQIQVLVDPERLRSHKVSLKQVLSSTGNALWYSPLSYLEASAPGSGGFIDTPNQRLSIRHVLPISTPADFAKVSVEGSLLTLGDVATIVEDNQPLIGDALVGKDEGVLLVIEKFPWADTLSVTRGVEAALEDLRPGLPGVEINSRVFRRANFIEASMQNIWLAAIIAAVLLLVSLVVLHRSWKSVVVAAVAIPVSMASALTVLYFSSLKPDIVMLAGLAAAIGVFVNDATAGAETISRKADRNQPITAIIASAFNTSRGSFVIASLIAVLASLPLFAISGVAGAVAFSLAVSFGLAVVISAIASVTLVPAIWIILHSIAPGTSSHSSIPAAPAYLSPVRSSSGLLAGGAAMLALVTVAVTAISERAILPSFNEHAVLIDWAGAPGTSRSATVRVASSLLAEVRTIPGVESAGAHIGRAITSDSTGNVNAAQFWINIDPNADRAETLGAIGAIVDNYPGSAREILNYSDEQTREFNLPREIDTLKVRVFGYELDTLASLAEQVRSSLEGVAGDRGVTVEEQVIEPVLKIEANLEKSKSFGIKPGDIRRTAAVLLSGLEVGSLFEDQKVFEVVVWGVPEIRNDVTAISDILIDAPGGGFVRLGDVANVTIGSLPNVIRRDAASRYRDVLVDVRGANVAGVASEIEARLADMHFPLEYHAELQPDYVVARDSRNRLLFAIMAAAAGIFLLVQAAVGGWLLAAATFVAILAAVSGGVIVMGLTGNVMSAGAAVGLIGTFAVAARGTLALINRYQTLERSGAVSGFDLVDRGSRDQFLTTVATGICTAAVLLPAAVLGASRPGLEVLAPLAMVMIGGLISVTLVNLYIVPMLYLLFGAGAATEKSEAFVQEGQFDVS